MRSRFAAGPGPLASSSIVMRRATLPHRDGLRPRHPPGRRASPPPSGSARSCPRCSPARSRAGDLGVDFDGTDFAFLEQPGLPARASSSRWSLDVRRCAAAPRHAGRGRGAVGGDRRSALGALLCAGDARRPRLRLVAGPRRRRCRAPLLGQRRAARSSPRARARLDAEARERAAALRRGRGAGARRRSSILFPPLALVVDRRASSGCSLGGRRREGEKYAGLRILR